MLNNQGLSKLGIKSYLDLETLLNRDDVKRMIGKNYDHYRELWLARYRYLIMKEPKEKVKGAFNWLAFLLFPVWFGYRRMYLFYFVISLLVAAIVFAEEYYNLNSVSLAGVGLAFGFWGKDYYLLHIIRSVAKIDSMPNRERAENFLKWRSGTSILLAVLALPVSIALNIAAIILASYILGKDPF